MLHGVSFGGLLCSVLKWPMVYVEVLLDIYLEALVLAISSTQEAFEERSGKSQLWSLILNFRKASNLSG